jgi:hypothetical protein
VNPLQLQLPQCLAQMSLSIVFFVMNPPLDRAGKAENTMPCFILYSTSAGKKISKQVTGYSARVFGYLIHQEKTTRMDGNF